jgi:hypothetical protein
MVAGVALRVYRSKKFVFIAPASLIFAYASQGIVGLRFTAAPP